MASNIYVQSLLRTFMGMTLPCGKRWHRNWASLLRYIQNIRKTPQVSRRDREKRRKAFQEGYTQKYPGPGFKRTMGTMGFRECCCCGSVR